MAEIGSIEIMAEKGRIGRERSKKADSLKIAENYLSRKQVNCKILQ